MQLWMLGIRSHLASRTMHNGLNLANKIVTIQVEKLTGTPEKGALIDSIRFMLCLRTVEK